MAIDDAYSRHIMMLKPQFYLRLNNIATGNTSTTDEVGMGRGYSLAGYAPFLNPLAAGCALADSLVPSVSGGTHLKFNNARTSMIHPYGATNIGTTTSKGTRLNQMRTSINFWYRNPTSPGAVNQRAFTHRIAEATTNSPVLSMFNWNSADNGLVELVFKRKADLLGTWGNRGGTETYRYLYFTNNNTLNTVHMTTLTLSTDTATLYRDGVKQSEFTWNPLHYGLMLPSYNGATLGASYDTSNQGYFDGSTCEMSEFSIHKKTLSELEVAEIYHVGINGTYSRSIVGTVTDGVGVGLARMVRAHSTRDGALLGETTSAVDGTFTLGVPGWHTGATYVLAFDDLGIAPDYNAAIQTNVIPT